MRRLRASATLAAALGVASLAACGPGRLPLRSVTLYGNGLGYFERSGELSGRTLQLRLRPHEIDDVLKTLAVLSDDGAQVGAVAALRSHKDGATLELTMPSSARRTLRIGYAAPTPAWTPIYRAVLDLKPGEGQLQAWAVVQNPSDEDWDGKLTLVTGAPFSLAVDLHSPRFVARPDATGKLVTPTLTEAVSSESTRPGDADGDGVLDEKDLCPDAAEDRDGFEDDDGCPDPDNDKDRIPDDKDKCPNEPETYNGFEDDDGCPDRGRVVVTHASLEILDNLYFKENSAELQAAQRPIVEAIAATLNGNPQILRTEVGGHASDNEKDALGLSMRRAAAVVGALVALKVPRERLVLKGYGARKPARTGTDEKTRAVNRRVAFLILKRSDAGSAEDAAPPITSSNLAASVAPVATQVEAGAGVVRYTVESAVRVPRRSSAIVALLNQPVKAEEIYLYRPESGVAGSDYAPMRAARVVAPAGATLEPGPIAIYARGAFVGDALLDRLHAGESTIVPFALDGSAVVHTTRSSDPEPLRIVALRGPTAELEDHLVHRTRYEIATGAETPARLFIHHPRELDLTPRAVPPGVETTATALLWPTPVKPNDHATVVVEEVAATRRYPVNLAEIDPDRIAPFLGKTALPAPVRGALEQAMQRRRALIALEKDAQRAEERLQAAIERRAQLDENLRALKQARGTDALRRDLSGKLADAIKLAEAASAMSAKVDAEVQKLRTELDAQLQQLSYPPPAESR